VQRGDIAAQISEALLPKYHSQWRQIALAESSNKNCNITSGGQIEAISCAPIS
jgi:hypothetical protein